MKILVGVPTLNGPDRLDRCLASIRKYTNTDLFDVTVLVSDDASTPENLKLNKDVVHRHGVEMLMSETRLGVSKQWNRLVRHVPDAGIVVLLNDDVEVVEDWLDVLVFSLARNYQLGMISLRCETGVTSETGQPRPRIDYHEADLLDANGTLLSSGGACFAFRRESWLLAGGFDERYFCFYEEIDFGVTLALKHNMWHAFASYPIVYHLGGATIATNHDGNAVLLESRGAFWAKWQKTLDQMRDELWQRRRDDLLLWFEWNTAVKVSRHP